MNRRRWYVLVSIPSDDGGYCVDFFERPTGGFGFQHFRTDAEDQGSWTTVGTPNDGHPTATQAAAAAASAVPWLTRNRTAKLSFEDWLATLT